jgi:hypothetical protein
VEIRTQNSLAYEYAGLAQTEKTYAFIVVGPVTIEFLPKIKS